MNTQHIKKAFSEVTLKTLKHTEILTTLIFKTTITSSKTVSISSINL